MGDINVGEIVKTFCDNYLKAAGPVATTKLNEFLGKVQNSNVDVVKKQYDLICSLMEQKNKKQITEEEFNGYMADIQKLWEMQALGLQLEIKNLINGLTNDLVNLFINKLAGK